MRLVLALFWTLLILAGCSIPGEDLPGIDLFSFDKIIHFSMFAAFGILWHRAWPTRPWQVFLMGVAYAIGTEIYQGFLPWERTPDPMDALANIAGLAAAWLAWWGWRQHKLKRTP